MLANAVHDRPLQSEYPVGLQLTYECNIGYIQNGDPQIMCAENEQWTRMDMACEGNCLYDAYVIFINTPICKIFNRLGI